MDIAALMQAQGWSSNPWATAIRDLVIDFGLLGAVICAFILGYVAQRVFNNGLSNPGYMANVSAAYVSAGSFVFAFVGPAQIRAITTPLIIIAAIYLLTRKPRRVTATSRDSVSAA